MNLQEAIEEMKSNTLSKLPEETLSTIMNATEELIRSGIAEKAKDAGDKISDFALPNARGEEISVSSFLKKGPLVINFYRGAWCPYCNLELKALNDAYPSIKEYGANLISISPNLREKTAQFASENPFQFEILSDEGNRVAGQFGLVFTLVEELRPIYEKFGFSIPDYNGPDNYDIPIPATYIVATDSSIVHAYVNPDYTQRMEATEIVSILQKMKGEN